MLFLVTYGILNWEFDTLQTTNNSYTPQITSIRVHSKEWFLNYLVVLSSVFCITQKNQAVSLVNYARVKHIPTCTLNRSPDLRFWTYPQRKANCSIHHKPLTGSRLVSAASSHPIHKDGGGKRKRGGTFISLLFMRPRMFQSFDYILLCQLPDHPSVPPAETAALPIDILGPTDPL